MRLLELLWLWRAHRAHWWGTAGFGLRRRRRQPAFFGSEAPMRLRSGPAGDGGDEEDSVTFFQSAGFAAQEADVFFVEINVEKLADLAGVVADVAA